jgi:hypothetical protein
MVKCKYNSRISMLCNKCEQSMVGYLGELSVYGSLSFRGARTACLAFVVQITNINMFHSSGIVM